MNNKRKGLISVIVAIAIIISLWFVIQQPFINKDNCLVSDLVSQENYIIKPPVNLWFKRHLK